LPDRVSLEGSAETITEKEKNRMKKIVVLLTGMVFIFGAMVPISYAQLKKERQAPDNPVPKQNTVHIGVDKKDKKDAPAAASEQKSPAAPEQKAVTSEPPAPADTKAQSAQSAKKDKKAKKSKKTKKAPTN
jgi:hypothetical protein